MANFNGSTGTVDFKLKQLKMVSKIISSKNTSNSWSASSSSQAFSELSRAQSLLGAYLVGAGR